jgi:uncharacterized membrane protein
VDPKQTWDDHRIENIVGKLLQTGVSLAAAVVFTGAVIYLFRHGREPAQYHIFHGEPAEYKTFAGILRGVTKFRGRDFIQLGLLLLIATPVARVAFSIWGFAEEKDKMYVGITLLVLTILLYSLVGSGSAF